MQALEIGQRVIVRAISTMGYDGHNNRVVNRNSIVPVDAVITGQAVRYLGKYHRSHGGDGWGEDYTPAELAVSGSVTLWCVRMGLKNREHLVQDADLEPGSVRPHLGSQAIYMSMPKRAPRLTYIASPEEPVTIEAGEVKRITFQEPILLT
jgi:hypothetical protein